MKKYFAIVTFLFFCTADISAQQLTHYIGENWMVPDGRVNAVLKSGNTVYLAGIFRNMGYPKSFGSMIDTGTGLANINAVEPNAAVYQSIPDGAGGWYIVGYFTKVGNEPRNGAARINADGTLNPWNPNTNYSVQSITMGDSTVYIGSAGLASVGGQTRYYVAEVDTNLGSPTAWNPIQSAPQGNSYGINSLLVVGDKLYVGGYFTTLNGMAHKSLARIDRVTGIVDAWNPNVAAITGPGYVYALALKGNRLYVGGDFYYFNGQTRPNLAAMDITTDALCRCLK